MRITRGQLSGLIREEIRRLDELSILGHSVEIVDGRIVFTGPKGPTRWRITAKGFTLSVRSLAQLGDAVNVTIGTPTIPFLSDGSDKKGSIASNRVRELVDGFLSGVGFNLDVIDPDTQKETSLTFSVV